MSPGLIADVSKRRTVHKLCSKVSEFLTKSLMRFYTDIYIIIMMIQNHNRLWMYHNGNILKVDSICMEWISFAIDFVYGRQVPLS